MLNPSYVEGGSFNVVRDQEIGCLGRKLRYRVYRLKDNPDQRPGNDISHSVVAKWASSGSPEDAVFHLGSFHRITVI
ncbi:hypothetical protein [Brucella sp. IR073]|uniref:hypothetical protein n=1 Tax=unclassified Brucella TaxID=2632610 RepID=UPI003B986069